MGYQYPFNYKVFFPFLFVFKTWNKEEIPVANVFVTEDSTLVHNLVDGVPW